MKVEQIPMAAQILTAMKDSAKELEKAIKKEDNDAVLEIKKELLDLHRKFTETL
ncbi:MAG TPA: hypothetical protein VHA12_02935 [Candidatus Nanoarchaeia archaeon]|nr:hypothetical protein [Candidatus Nanoarchaeia archaeon]